jgi:hypothetical protein
MREPLGVALACAITVAASIICACTATSAAGTLPAAPTELTGNGGLSVRPAVIGFTGDGTGYLGGFTGRRAVPHPSRSALRWAGHLSWTAWSATEAQGRGAIWLNDGEPNDARGTFRPSAVKVRLFRVVNHVFTRLELRDSFGGKPVKEVLQARYFPPTEYGEGYWEW